MFKLYVFRGKRKKEPALGEVLNKVCLNHWFLSKGIKPGEHDSLVVKNESGKPIVESDFPDPVYVSITHSDDLFGILIGDKPCGLDFQIPASCSYEKISDKYFSEKEKKYVGQEGIDEEEKIGRFYRIWTRKEAYGKLSGKGFFSRMPDLSNEDEVKYKRKRCKLFEISLVPIDRREVYTSAIVLDDDIKPEDIDIKEVKVGPNLEILITRPGER